MAVILLTTDDLEIAVPVNAALEGTGHVTHLVAPVDDARIAFRRAQPDLVLLSGNVYEAAAVALAALARDHEVSTLALLEATDQTDRLERAAKFGVTETLVKPVRADDVVATVERLLERRALQLRTGIIGESAPIQEVLIKIEQMAPVSSTVLIQGESGTGKELVAKAIHDLSGRRGQPFIAINCAALPESLLESELFGHEKGAFTGAAERRLGRFELADRGTIFLDEIGEIPPSVQVKLLRVLETRSFFRVGGTAPIKVNVRVVAATNRALREAVGLGEFRDDLYYRLSVLNIYLPPLRERRSDVPLLVRRFIREFARQHERTFRGISADALRALVQAAWPGNIRQLRNLIESMVVLAPGTEISVADIPADVMEGTRRLLPARISGPAGNLPGQEMEFILRSLMDLRVQVEEMRRRLDGPVPGRVQVVDLHEHTPLEGYTVDLESVPESVQIVWKSGMTMAEVEKAVIIAALTEYKGNRRKAADVLGIGERTLYRKLKEFELD